MLTFQSKDEGGCLHSMDVKYTMIKTEPCHVHRKACVALGFMVSHSLGEFLQETYIMYVKTSVL